MEDKKYACAIRHQWERRREFEYMSGTIVAFLAGLLCGTFPSIWHVGGHATGRFAFFWRFLLSNFGRKCVKFESGEGRGRFRGRSRGKVIFFSRKTIHHSGSHVEWLCFPAFCMMIKGTRDSIPDDLGIRANSYNCSKALIKYQNELVKGLGEIRSASPSEKMKGTENELR